MKTDGPKEAVGGFAHAYYLECGDSVMDVCICPY